MIREGSSNRIRKTVDKRISDTVEFKSGVKGQWIGDY